MSEELQDIQKMATEAEIREIIERGIYILLNFTATYLTYRSLEFLPSLQDLYSIGGDDGSLFTGNKQQQQKKLNVDVSTKNSGDKKVAGIIDFGIFTVIKYTFYFVHVFGVYASIVMNVLSGSALIMNPNQFLGTPAEYSIRWFMEKYTTWSQIGLLGLVALTLASLVLGLILSNGTYALIGFGLGGVGVAEQVVFQSPIWISTGFLKRLA
ncbi:UNKNOWN [Stylonychia lemnae]|uniref:Uncharacterized protein n=1 Tax=Stylonychia lemnae TaxID=5949 RepID=A0A078ADH8_STYLE|nr:UNKNOWN [Stylonychia lemnae]|eukprot:CDW78918.1 UNKNOWN [Stylonychia lemnae]